jgi:hypothetical protein
MGTKFKAVASGGRWQWNVIAVDPSGNIRTIVAEVVGRDAKRDATVFAAAHEALAACEALILGDDIQVAIDKAREALKAVGRIQ